MSPLENPERDHLIITAHRALLKAQEELAAKKTPFAALEVQDKRQRWETARKLELVKKGSDDRETA